MAKNSNERKSIFFGSDTDWKRLEEPELEGPEDFEKKYQNVPGAAGPAVGAAAASAAASAVFALGGFVSVLERSGNDLETFWGGFESQGRQFSRFFRAGMSDAVTSNML